MRSRRAGRLRESGLQLQLRRHPQQRWHMEIKGSGKSGKKRRVLWHTDNKGSGKSGKKRRVLVMVVQPVE
jgi:hypothetical protein